MNKNDIDVFVGDGCLTIRGNKKRNYQDSDIWGNWTSERSYGKVERTIQLPFDADLSISQSSYDQGILTVSVPKLSTVPGKKLTIT